MVTGEEERTTKSSELEDYHVRLPADLKQRLPAAKIRTGKKIQEFVQDAIREHLKRVNL